MSAPDAELHGDILVADDEESIRWVLERACAQAGHTVKTVATGAQALAALESARLRPGPGRHPHAGPVRPRRAVARARGRHRHALHRDDGTEHDGERHRGHQARRLRLPDQAVRSRAGGGLGEPRTLAPSAHQGHRAPARRTQTASRAGDRAQPRHAGGLQGDRPCRAHRRDRAHPGRNRDRQRTGGQHAPLPFRPARPVRRHQLLGDPQRTARERALRLRTRRLHRRDGATDRQVRGSRRRHAVSRRDCGHAARSAGQGAPSAPGTRVHARRRARRHPGRRPHRRGHQPGPGSRRSRRAFSRGPLLPPQRRPHTRCRRCGNDAATSRS